jgi:purine-binding chemotaxis protein CheW
MATNWRDPAADADGAAGWHEPCLVGIVTRRRERGEEIPPCAGRDGRDGRALHPEDDCMPMDTVAATPARPGKYLSFLMGCEEYGLELAKVREIISRADPVRVPRTPPCLRGVMELRGRVIPVVDLRRRLQAPGGVEGEAPCVVVLELSRRDLDLRIGLVVDEVSELLSFTQEQIEPATDPPGSAVGAACVTGLGKLGAKVVILLDADRLLEREELEAVAQVAPWRVGAATGTPPVPVTA